MRYLTVIIILLLTQNCSTTDTQDKQTGTTEVNSLTTNSEDGFQASDSVFFKQYINNQGQYITEQQKVTFDNGSGKTKKNMFIVSKLNSTFIGGAMQAINKMNIKAYTTKDKKYDEVVWELNKEDEEPFGPWGHYYKTVIYGCCGGEDCYTIYDIETGKEFLKFNDIQYTAIPYYLNFGYLSTSSMCFSDRTDKTLIGHFYHMQENLITKEDDLTTFTVHSKSQDPEIVFTPEMSFEFKDRLKETGFFKNYVLFQNGDTLKTLDTADYYIVLKYYDITKSILLPIDENGLRESGYLSNDKSLSEEWVIKRK